MSRADWTELPADTSESLAPSVASEGFEPGSSVGSLESIGSSGSGALSECAEREAFAVGPMSGLDVARYRVGREIGKGGMGRVSLVRDLRLLRDVAWKRGDFRLLREARILAQLEHPGIVPIHDMGIGPDGEAFFAMRVVRGKSLAQVLRETPPAERAGLLRPLLQAAEAVAFAHHRGVVHRDLKPANVMIGSFGESQVVDWGLARVLDSAEEPMPIEVREALAGKETGRVGTPGYMSPEQAAGTPADRRSDVFGLGRILADIIGAPADSAIASPEILAIVARATAPEPCDRYPDAAAFAADLASLLDGRRVRAYAYRPGELLRRFLRTYRIPLFIVALALTALGVFGVMHVVSLEEERMIARRAESETRVALARSDRHLARSLIGEARRLIGEGARAEAEVLAAHALTLTEDADARGILSSLGGAPAPELLSRAPIPCAESQVDPVRDLVLCVQPEGVELWDYALSPPARRWDAQFRLRAATLVDGGVVLASSETSDVVALDLAGHSLLHEHGRVSPTRKTSVAGSRVVFETAGASLLVDVALRQIGAVKPCDGLLHSALIPSREARPGAELDAALCKDGTLRLPEGALPTALVAPEREGVRMALLGSDGFVVGTTKGEVVVLGRGGEVRHARRVVRGMVRLLAPSPDGRVLAVAGEGDPIELLSLPELARIGSLPARAKTLAWDPTRPGELVTTGAWLERWHLTPADPARPVSGAYEIPLVDGVTALDVDPSDPGRLGVALGPHVAVVTPTHMLTRHGGFTTAKGVGYAGAKLVAAGVSGVVVFDAETLTVDRKISGWAVRRLATLADGSLLVANFGSLQRMVDSQFALVVEGPPLDLSVTADRRFGVLLREADRTLWRVRSGVPGAELVGVDPRAEAVAIHTAGDRFFCARRGEVAVWDEGGHLERVHLAGQTQLTDVEVSPDGRWIAAGAREGDVYLWEEGEPMPRARFSDHTERVQALAFAADSRWLVSGSWDRTLRIRDLAVAAAPIEGVRARISRRYALDLGEALGAGPTLGR